MWLHTSRHIRSENCLQSFRDLGLLSAYCRGEGSQITFKNLTKFSTIPKDHVTIPTALSVLMQRDPTNCMEDMKHADKISKISWSIFKPVCTLKQGNALPCRLNFVTNRCSLVWHFFLSCPFLLQLFKTHSNVDKRFILPSFLFT